MANTIIGVDVELNDAPVKSIKAQLREANNELVKMAAEFGRGSEQAVIAAKKVANLKDAIGDAKNLVEQFNPDQKFRALTTIVSGAASGFTALQGAIGLFGAENENVAKSLQKIQAAMAFSQGINQLGDLKDGLKNAMTVISQLTIVQKTNALANQLTAATFRLLGISVEGTAVSFQVLKTALIATGIGALVVILGTVIGKIMEWTSSTESAETAQKSLNDAIEESNIQLEQELKGIDYVNKALKLRASLAGATAKDLAAIDKKSNADRLQALRDNVTDIDKIRDRANKNEKLKGKEKTELLEKIDKDGLEASRKVTEQIQKGDLDALAAQTEAAKKTKEVRKNSLDDLLTSIDAETKLQVEKRKAISDNEAATLEIENAARNKKIAALQVYLGTLQASDEPERRGTLKSIAQLQSDITLAETTFEDARQKRLLADRQKRIDLSVNGGSNITNQKDVAKGEKEARDEKEKADKEITDKILANQQLVLNGQQESAFKAVEIADAELIHQRELTEQKKALREQEVAQTATALNAISELVGAQTIAGKALAIGASIINTYQGATKALAQGGFLGIVSAAAVIATGLNAVRKIINTQLPVAGGGSAGASAPGVSGLQATSPLTPTTIAANTVTLDQRSLNALSNQVVTAVVVETQVTNVQNKVRRIERSNKFG